MLSNLPPKQRKRMLTVYLVVTVIGGVTVILLLVLLGLLYWMYADLALPEPERLIHPAAAAYCIAEIEPADRFARNLSPAVLAALSGGERSPAAPLIHQAGQSDNCPIQVVGSIVNRGGKPRRAFIVTLGRFPGMFYLKRRDLERRAEAQTISASAQRHEGKTLFMSDDWSPFPAVGIVHCSIMRGTDAETLTPLIDRLLADHVPPADWPDPKTLRLESPSAANLWGWSLHWPALSSFGILDRNAAALKRFEDALRNSFPALDQATDIRFWGQTFPRGCHLRLVFTAPSAPQAAQLADRLPSWLRQHGHTIGLSAPEASYDPDRSRVEIKARLDLRGQ